MDERSAVRLAWLGFALGSACLAGAATVVAPAFAQSYPSRQITLVVPFTPGTGIDIVARTLGPVLAQRWGQPVVVENKPGASGNLGADIVAKSQPHGYTMMVSVLTFAMTPGVSPNLPYDPINDFTPLAEVARGGMALVVNPKALPVTSVQELIATAKAKPGALNYASPGNGTAQHLGMELFKQQLGLDIVHIPYKGTAGALADLLGGHVHMYYLPVHNALPYVQDDKLRVMAVASAKRSIMAPNAPSFQELGYANMDIELWYGIFAPAKLPEPIVQKWESELSSITALPEVKESLLKQGMVATYAPSRDFAKTVKDDVVRWRAVVEKAGIKPD